MHVPRGSVPVRSIASTATVLYIFLLGSSVTTLLSVVVVVAPGASVVVVPVVTVAVVVAVPEKSEVTRSYIVVL